MVGTVVAPVAPKLWDNWQKPAHSTGSAKPTIEGQLVDYCIDIALHAEIPACYFLRAARSAALRK